MAILRTSPASVIGRRLLGGALANLLDKLVLLAVQLVTIPLLSHHWGADGYGTWLMLMTIPTYVAVSDFGLGTAAGVEITQRVAKGDTTGALEAFQSVWAFVLCILGAIGVVAATWAGLVVSRIVTGSAELAVGALIVTLYAIAVVQMNTVALVYRATHKFALAMLISAAVIAAEGLALVVVVLLGGQLVAAAGVMLTIRLAGWVMTYVVIRRIEPWARLGVGSVRMDTVRRLAHPSIAALSLTLASSISLQGMVLVLGWTAGPAVAAVFGAARFIARIPLQFSGLVVRASMPELTRAQAADDHGLAQKLTRLNVVSAVAPTLPFVPVLAVGGPFLLKVMSGDRLNAEWWLFAVLAATTVLGALWQATSSPIVAANQQSRFAYAYAALSLMAVGSVLIPGLPPLETASLAALGAELGLAILVFRLSRAAR